MSSESEYQTLAILQAMEGKLDALSGSVREASQRIDGLRHVLTEQVAIREIHHQTLVQRIDRISNRIEHIADSI